MYMERVYIAASELILVKGLKERDSGKEAGLCIGRASSLGQRLIAFRGCSRLGQQRGADASELVCDK